MSKNNNKNLPKITPDMFPSMTEKEAKELIARRFTKKHLERAAKSFYKTTYPAMKRLAQE